VDDGYLFGTTLNRIFGGICAAERQLILAGLRFSLGGSLLVAARKPS
jgi:hypothetical protein